MNIKMKFFLFYVLSGVCLLLTETLAHAQGRSRLDLDDMMIKGQLQSDDRLVIMARQRNELKNFVKFRTSYREEMLQELPVPNKKKKFR